MSRDRLPLNCPYAELIVRGTEGGNKGTTAYTVIECPAKNCDANGSLVEGDPIARVSRAESQLKAMESAKRIADQMLPAACAVKLGKITPFTSRSIKLPIS